MGMGACPTTPNGVVGTGLSAPIFIRGRFAPRIKDFRFNPLRGIIPRGLKRKF
jgi:hypothetical protein